MRKKNIRAGIASVLLVLCLLTTFTVIITACDTNSGPTGPNPVHLKENTFDPSSITIKKGEVIILISDSFTAHTITNGTWDNGAMKLKVEPGAPVNTVQTSRTNQPFGPFTTAGTFYLLCTAHPGMNLTVIVQ
jgi:plastocyanin